MSKKGAFYKNFDESLRDHESICQTRDKGAKIISYPIPEIGDNFEEIFKEVVKVNTLDKDKYDSSATFDRCPESGSGSSYQRKRKE